MFGRSWVQFPSGTQILFFSLSQARDMLNISSFTYKRHGNTNKIVVVVVASVDFVNKVLRKRVYSCINTK